MKKNIFIWIFVALISNPLFSTESKIIQIVTGPKYSMKETPWVYFVTENNELYNCNHDVNQPYNKITLPDYQVVLIGKPIFLENTSWTMPAVLKEKGILGIFKRPYIGTVTFHYTNNSTNFINAKHYEGHRTKALKVGIFKKKSYLLSSGSGWPTIKQREIPRSFNRLDTEDKDAYLFDINEHHYYQAPAKKSFFSKNNKWTFTLNQTKQITMSHLPNITFDPKLNSQEQQTDLLNALTKYKTLGLGEGDYLFYAEQYYLSVNISSDKKNLSYNQYDMQTDKHFIQNTIEAGQNCIITACTFDFDKTLLYASYNTKTGKATINKAMLHNIYNESDTYDPEDEKLRL